MPKLPKLTLMIAWRFYKHKSSIRVLSFINWLTKLGIILGISILLLTNAVLNGFDQQLHSRFLNLIPQAVVFTPNNQSFIDGARLEKEFKQFGNVAAITPLVSKTVLLENGTQRQVVQAFAVEPQSFAQVSSLGDYLKQQGGLTTLISSSLDPYSQNSLLAKANLLVAHTKNQDEYNTYLNTPSIVLGKQLAQNLNIEVGDFVRMYIFSQNSRLEQNQYFIVSGIIDSNGLFDKELTLYNIYDAMGIVGLVNSNCPYPNVGANGEITPVKDPEANCLLTSQAGKIKAQDIANAFQIKLVDPDNLNIVPYQGWTSQQSISYTTWGQVYPNIYHDIPMIKSLLNIGLIFVLTLASFNIICSILIQIRDKKKSITSLQAVGLSTWQIHQIFIYYSLILAGYAVVIGLTLGALLSFALEYLSTALLDAGVEVISASNYFIDYIPVELKLSDMLIITGSVLLVALATALLTSLFTNKNKVDVNLLA
ncbi:hypothetical protein CKF54_06455 [Psittacicella hinzii]|uniref:ABC3 transporter permease protein domain-containing protein n=1 Tax=Psittacicella hinzii TaxID=2028575 RepID=A0A3A1Y675_9GAMM|nr:FtsX-like permease family protein [Psittacicella hinzii]RIY31554.1 hypothetical protein CKF54_06455 [Psittacicella hinzii]